MTKKVINESSLTKNDEKDLRNRLKTIVDKINKESDKNDDLSSHSSDDTKLDVKRSLSFFGFSNIDLFFSLMKNRIQSSEKLKEQFFYDHNYIFHGKLSIYADRQQDNKLELQTTIFLSLFPLIIPV